MNCKPIRTYIFLYTLYDFNIQHTDIVYLHRETLPELAQPYCYWLFRNKNESYFQNNVLKISIHKHL